LRIYKTTEPADALHRFYERNLARQKLFPAAGASADGTTAYQRADGYQVFVTISGASDTSFVTLTEAGSLHGSSVLTLTAAPEAG
jgi:hypothetical protein